MSDDDRVSQIPGAVAWMARNSVAANLLALVIIIGGLLNLGRIKQEVFPEFNLDIVTVVVPYPGAAPAEVEQGIALAIEEAVRGVDGVKKVTSNSTEGAASVVIELLLGSDPDKVLQEVKNEVDRIRTFPEEAEDPQVALLSRKQKVITLILAGDQERATLHALAEKARADLLATGQVTQVEVEGIPPLELTIEIDRAALMSFGLTYDDVARQISLSSLELPGGALETEAGELLVRVSDRARSAEEFGQIIVLSTADGAQVRLKDVARIVDGYEDNDQASYFRGHPAALVTVYRVGSETPTGIADTVKAYAERLRTELPPTVTATIWDDDSELLRGRIDLLVRNAQSGLILVALVLAAFLDNRLALWVGFGIPLSFAGALFVMPILGVSINMISLFALIITLGIVVDDAIVVGENVYEKTEKGMEPLLAAIEGTREMVMPVTFAVLTTFAAFMPMLAIPGVTGKIFGIIPLIVISVLSFSLVESFFTLPSHLGHRGGLFDRMLDRVIALLFGLMAAFAGYMNASSHASSTELGLRFVIYGALGLLLFAVTVRARPAIARGLRYFVEDMYAPVLRWAITYRYATTAASIAMFLIAFQLVATGLLPFSFLPKIEADIVRVSARLPYGVTIERTEAIRAEIERALEEAIVAVDAESGVRGVLTLVGQGNAAGGPGGGSRPVGSHLVTVEVDLVPTADRDFTTAALSAAWQERVPMLPGVEALTFSSDIGANSGAAVDVQLSHPNTEVLALASEELTHSLRGYSDLKNVENGYAAGKSQLDFVLLPNARTLGLTTADIARQLRSAFYGAEAIREQRGRNELKVMVRLPEDQRLSEYDLEQLDVRTPTGAYVPLSSVASFERGRSATTITREAGQRVVDVKAELAPGAKSSRSVVESLEAEVLPALKQKYPGLNTRFAGEAEARDESLGELGKNYVFALFAIYALLAVPFKSYVQPIIIMSAIPLGFVGAVGGHVLMGFELSVISIMGIVALSGVVVNDSLVMIDAANTFRREGESPLEAIQNAGKRRFRPIMLTSVTTFFGLLPMIFEPSVQARFLIPMAISLGYGVLFATVITLLIVPALYIILEDLAALSGRVVAFVSPGRAPFEAPAGK
jgi:multidrug efflux pump subunit AcrB